MRPKVTSLLVTGIAVVTFVLLLIEMLTYSVGQGGAVTRWYQIWKPTNIDLVIGGAIAGLMIWKGSSFVAIVGVVAFLFFGIKAVIRVDRRLRDEAEMSKERS